MAGSNEAEFLVTADFKKFLNEQLKVYKSIKKNEAEFARFGAAADAANNKGKKAAGAHKSSMLAFAGTAAAVVGSYGLAKKAAQELLGLMREIETERKKAAASTISEENIIKRLAQVAGPERPLEGLIQQYRRLSGVAGITKQAAGSLVFQGISIEKEKQVAALAREMAKFTPSAEISPLIESAYTVQQSVPSWTLRQIINTYGVSAKTTKLGIEQLGKPIAETIPMARRVQGARFNLEEIISTVAAIVGPTTSGEQATTQLRAFMKGLDKSGLTGMNIIDSIRAVQQLDPKSKAYKEVFGRVESALFFESAKQPHIQAKMLAGEQDLIAARKAAGTPDSYIQQQATEFLKSPTGRALLGRLQSEQQLDSVRAGAFGIPELQTQAWMDNIMADSIISGETPLARAARKRALERAKESGFRGRQLERIGDWGVREGRFLEDALMFLQGAAPVVYGLFPSQGPLPRDRQSALETRAEVDASMKMLREQRLKARQAEPKTMKMGGGGLGVGVDLWQLMWGKKAVDWYKNQPQPDPSRVPIATYGPETPISQIPVPAKPIATYGPETPIASQPVYDPVKYDQLSARAFLKAYPGADYKTLMQWQSRRKYDKMGHVIAGGPGPIPMTDRDQSP
jgi:hypothetical protein